jgi:hypothetical protein
MIIYEQIKEILKDRKGDIVTSTEMKREAKKRFGANPGSIIISDFCYNRINDGIKFDKHLFEYLERNTYKFLGENYPYTGKIYHRPQHQKEREVGEWKKGVKYIN